MDKLYYRPLGKSVFISWEEIDHQFNQWAKAYFGPHASASGDRDETSCNLFVFGLKEEDFPKFEQLFTDHDKDGDFDAAEEWDEYKDGTYQSLLPECVTRGAMTHMAVAIGLKEWGSHIATYDGVFIMERDNDYQRFQSVPSPELPASSLDGKIADAQTRQGTPNKEPLDKDEPQI